MIFPIFGSWKVIPHLCGFVIGALWFAFAYKLLCLVRGFGEAWSGQGPDHDWPERLFITGMVVCSLVYFFKFILIEARRRVLADELKLKGEKKD